ncbi:ABC transporter ATP-binding protein [candidate division KSB1 bacterium]|nr:MAG: ABC transporter ATP-binding protein [candidate division KSB1 bacterium]
MNALKRLLPYLRPYRTSILIGALVAVLNNAVGAAGPWLLKLAVDGLQSGVTLGLLAWYALLFVAIAAVAGVLRFYMRQILIGMSRHAELDLRNALFAHLQKLPASFYNKHRTGDIMARLTSDLESVRSVLGPGVMYPLDTISMALFTLTMMFLLSVKLTVAVLLAAPLVSFTVFYLGKITYKLHTRIQQQFSALSDCAEENLAGVRVVRAFAQEDRELGKFNELNHEYVRRNLAMTRVQAAFMPVMVMMFELATVMILLFGGRGIIRGELSLGDFVAFVGYLSMLAWPMIAVGWVANLFQRGAASMKRLCDILDIEPEIAPPPESRRSELPRGEIVFEKVRFCYNDQRTALADLDFRIDAGKIVAFVGRTGSGKSTLISLIPRLFDPTEGRVLVDGIPTTEWNLSELRAMIGMVPQDALLFSDTLRANVCFGVSDATDEHFLVATDVSQINRDVESFRSGYETVVGERGLTLSGGQKGRTALARALMKNPCILILDDALSAVDTQTEDQILGGLRRFMADRTSIIISHRVSTVKHADEIFVLDEGRVVERGTHEQLIALGGYYTELERMQRLEAELEEIDEDSRI